MEWNGIDGFLVTNACKTNPVLLYNICCNYNKTKSTPIQSARSPTNNTSIDLLNKPPLPQRSINDFLPTQRFILVRRLVSPVEDLDIGKLAD